MTLRILFRILFLVTKWVTKKGKRMDKIQIIKPISDEGYDVSVSKLLDHLLDALDTRVMTSHDSRIIRDLSDAFYSMTQSSRVIVTDQKAVGGYVDIGEKKEIDLPDKLKLKLEKLDEKLDDD